jgi:5-methylcytosine-specific restriction endonuclease McrA
MVRAHPASARVAVDNRDHGVCAACHLGCGSIREQILEATAEVIDLWNGDRGTRWVRWSRRSNVNKQWPQRMLAQVQAARQEILEPFGWDHLWRRSTFWDADHILPVAEGGESCLENLQTLCLTCHQAKTAAQAERKRLRKLPEVG